MQESSENKRFFIQSNNQFKREHNFINDQNPSTANYIKWLTKHNRFIRCGVCDGKFDTRMTVIDH